MNAWHCGGDPTQIGLSLLCSNVVLFFYSRILPCYCCYSHASLAIMIILCSFHNWENTLNLKREKVPPTGICLSLLFIVAAVTDGQNVTVLMLVVASPSSVSWRYLIYLLPCDNLRMHLAIIPAQCSNAFGLQLFLHYAQHNQLKPISRCTIMQIREIEQIRTYNWHQNVTEHNTISGHTIYSPMHNIAVDCGSG